MSNSINESQSGVLLSNLKNLNFTLEDQEKLDRARQDFVNYFTAEKVQSLLPEEYFQGKGKKEGCLTYHLEWATIDLGSIKGGSNYKFGYEEDFEKIKSLIFSIISSELTYSEVYGEGGELKSKVKDLIKRVDEIKGIRGGVVIAKILSIYYPDLFIGIFTHQEHFLKILYNDYVLQFRGLERYLVNNYLLLKIKEFLIQRISDSEAKLLTNDKFSRVLYYAFPKEVDGKQSIEELHEEPFNVLEVQHYQSLLHKNFSKLFPDLDYFDKSTQDINNGHYDTQEVGVMDFLCTDKDGNFVVIELKRKASDETLGQILRYMGWTKENLSKDKKVFGIILADSFDTKLEYAISIVRDIISLKKIKLDISIL